MSEAEVQQELGRWVEEFARLKIELAALNSKANAIPGLLSFVSELRCTVGRYPSLGWPHLETITPLLTGLLRVHERKEELADLLDKAGARPRP